MSVTIAPWETGTDEEIAAMLDAASAGEIDLQQDGGWAVGDHRTIQVNTFTACGITNPIENCRIEISSFDDYRSCGCLLQFDFKYTISTDFPMDDKLETDGGYGSTLMYTDILPAMTEALPTWLKTRLKTFSVMVGKGGKEGSSHFPFHLVEIVENNKLALRSVTEVFGETEGYPVDGIQLQYYKLEGTYNNSLHKPYAWDVGTSSKWFLRTPGGSNSYLVAQDSLTQSNLGAVNPTSTFQVAPFGCLGTRPQPGPNLEPRMSSWTYGTDEEVTAILDAAAGGDINLQRDAGWEVGDVRKIHLDTFTNGRVTNDAEDLYIVISSFDEYEGCGNLLQFDFVVIPTSQFNMDDRPGIEGTGTAEGGYAETEMYKITLPAMTEALPAWLKTRLKNFSVLVAESCYDTKVYQLKNNKLALRGDSEVFGIRLPYFPANEGLQLDYYKNADNRTKYLNANPYVGWWFLRTRTDNVGFGVCTSGEPSSANPNGEGGKAWLSPFGCLGGILATPPVIIRHPQSVTVTEGESASFLVSISGNFNCQWQSSTDEGETWNDIAGATKVKYDTVAALSMDGTQYRCVASNDAGTVYSNAATLTVEADTSIQLPVITQQPQSATVDEGNSATFTVTATGDDLHYQWQGNNTGTWFNITGETSASYTIAGTLGTSGMLFRCIVSNDAGAARSEEAMLTVTPVTNVQTPSISYNPSDVTVQEGNTASFRVVAQGGDLAYQWQVNRNGSWYNITDATSASYSLKAALTDNGTHYRCIVANSAGSVYSSGALLTVTAKPDVTPNQPTKINKYFLINGYDILPFIKDRGIKWSRNDVDGDNAGRVLGNANMQRDRLAIKVRCDLECRPLGTAEIQRLLAAIEPVFVTVQQNIDPRIGTSTRVMYSNNATVVIGTVYDDENDLYEDLTFPLIEQ